LINPGETDAWIASLASDGSWRVRAAAGARVAALRGHGDSAGSSAFEAFARDADPRVATAAIEALLDVAGPEGIPEHRTLLVELLQSPDIHLRAAVLRGFAMLGDPVTYPALLDAYDRARFDREPAAVLAALDAIAALGRNGNLTPERAFFARFPRSEDPLVRRRAAEYFPDAALAAWGEPLPVEAFWIDARYREHVALWVAPPGHPARLPRIRIETEYGPIEALLFGDLAPRTVANFLDLAYFGFFDDLEWPRVVPNFVVQGGDPRGDTYGGPGYSIRDEINRVRFGTGTLGMALDGPDTGGSQFFITLSPQPHLDGDYTVFGEVISGMDILERLLPGDRILSVREMTEDS
jgi:cyclophilin family peptidyl-prolyl cis-trans isomerase